MNLKACNNVDKNRYELEIEISAEDFEKALQTAFLKKKNKIVIPGFRKGKAPRNFIEKYYGETVFYEDAVNSIYPKALDDAINEAGLDVISDKIDFDIVKIGKEGFTFKATVTTRPEVSIDGYKGIEVTKNLKEVTDEDVSNEIEKVRERNARLISIENRPSQEGDIVVVDFDGSVDGEMFEGGAAENQHIKIGAKRFVPGFEEQMVGHKAGDEFSINITFPEDYTVKDLAGKDAIFNITMHAVNEQEFPALDDEFAKDVSEFDTLEEYKNDIKTKLTESFKKESEADVENQIIDKVVSLLQADVPEAMFNNKIEEYVRDFSNNLQAQGIDIDIYLEYTGGTMESFRNDLRPAAERNVKLRLALEKIAEIENFVASEEELESKFKEFSETYKIDVERIKQIIPSKEISADIACKKAMQLLKDTAVVK